MSGCFGNSAIDRWMEGQLNRYLDSCDGNFDFDFNHKFKKGGTVHVECEAEYYSERDEDGWSSGYTCKIKSIRWTFDKDFFDAELSDDQLSELESRAEDEKKEFIRNF